MGDAMQAATAATTPAITREKPIIVAAAFPASGHTLGLIQFSAHLVKKGFQVLFIGSGDFKSSIEHAGATFIEHSWKFSDRPEVLEAHDKITDPAGQLIFAMKHLFLDSTPQAFNLMNSTLESVRENYGPSREVVILHEIMYQGVVPYYLGAPLPKGYSRLPKVINFCPTLNIATDYAVPPFGPGLPYDPTPENLALWKSIHDQMHATARVVLCDHANPIYKSLGCTQQMTTWLWDELMRRFDVTLLASSASTDYPRSTPNPKVRYIGGLPLKPVSPDFKYPEWWSTITENAALEEGKKKVVFVTQGTAMLDYTELLIPSIKALSERDDLIVIATLGCRDEPVPQDVVPVPGHIKVIDYLPYDAMLPYTDVFVSNAGYGGFMHGVMNGVPMVLAGTAADKAEVCARAEWSGVAVNLRTARPSIEAIREALDKVLTEPAYKTRAAELKEENEAMDSLGTLEEIVWEMVVR
ncbi:hypothetical protein QBC46DRAFT_391693 [Diplogelasinospora grovesii]|uniref:Erythromycin biosynthesis protein CIII-like C-terminal domain-containing protein n=1 Tax=Diplogelasinospora grovesii TaxID=303347 RepID=A0AAN6N2H7_9PEZI|nr:hypothetical protein QBC46DRAFT_391693 [Diplogelasinospora grovesii]